MAANKYSPRLTPIASAVHAILVSATVASGGAVTVRSAHAGDEPGTESTKRSYRIPAGPLGPALTSFAAASGVLLSADPALTQGKTTRGLIGDFTPEEGLAALLAGTGLEWAPGPGGTYTVRVRATPEAPMPAGEQPVELDPIEVIGEPLEQGFKAEFQTTATKTPLPIHETPQSISVITRDSIESRFAQDTASALELAAGVSRDGNPGAFAGSGAASGSTGESFLIRGVTVNIRNDVREDGFSFPGAVTTELDVALYERIEAVKGPASALYGRGSAGGLINRIRKKPLPERQVDTGLTAGSFDLYRGEVDATGPITESGVIRGRFIGAYQQDDAFVDGVESERFVIAPSLEFDLTDSTRLLTQVTYQDDRFIPNTGFPLRPDGVNFTAPNIRRSLFVGVPNDDIDDTEATALIASVQLDQELSDRWLAKLRLNYSESRSEIAQDSYAYGFRAGGDTYLYSGFNRQNFDTWAGELNLDGSVDLFGREHQVLLGAEINQFDRDRDAAYSYLGVANIYDENFVDFPTVEPELISSRADQQENSAVFLQTVLNPFERAKVVLGGRYDWTNSQTRDLLGGGTDKTRDQAFTGRVGLVYDVVRNVSVYGTYAESFLPVLAESVSGILDPETGELFEMGVKGEFLDNRLGVSLAVFRLDRDDVPILDPDNRDFSVSAGLQRAEGVELELNGEPWPGWNISLAGTYLDAEFIERDDPNFGFKPAGTSEWQGACLPLMNCSQGRWPVLGLEAVCLRWASGSCRTIAMQRSMVTNESI